MFLGAINDKLRRFFGTHAALLEGRRLYIGCSGNFTTEQIISRGCANVEIHSNDIALYSSAIGYALTGRRFPLEITNPALSFALPTLESPIDVVATITLLLDALKFAPQKNEYARRMWAAYISQWPALHAKTCAKISAILQTIRITEYTTLDVFDYYPRADGVSIGFLPTYVGGYEAIYKRLEASVSYPRPSYQLLTADRRQATFDKMTAGGDYIIYSDQAVPGLPRVASVELFGRKTVHIYSNLPYPKALIRRKSQDSAPRFPILMPDDSFDASDPVTVMEQPAKVIDHYRHMFMSKNVQPAPGGPSYLVLIGGKVIGELMFQPYSKKGLAGAIYMLSDLAVPSMRYTRLAKLIVMIALCREVRDLIQEKTLCAYDSILTTARTTASVSMKYRGVMELHKRGEGFLNYKKQFSDISLQEVVGIWMKKYKQR